MFRRRFLVLGLILVLPLAAAVGCATNPVSGKREFSLVSGAQEEQIGRDGYQAVVSEFGLYEDAALTAYVNSVGQKLASASHLPNLDWHFTVVDDAAVNAFAMPGGYIYITRGILAHLNSEAQLAGVLGHEIGHVTARHSAQRITQQQLAGLGLGLASAFSEGFRRYSGAAETALGLMFLKYGREDEHQSDQLGIDYMSKAGFDPREVPSTYSLLKRIGEKGGERLPTFLSTHPDPGDRETRTAALARTAAAGKTGLQIGERAYLQRLEGLVFGRDPRQGYFEGERYYHPQLQFQISFPSGWKTQDTRSAVLAAEPNQRASMQLTLASAGDRSPSGFVDELLRTGKISDANGRSETIGGYPAWVGRLTVTDQNNAQTVLAAAFIRKAGDQMFQILGRSATPGDAYEERVIQSARSLRALTEAARLNVRPDRIRVISVTTTGSFESVVRAAGAQALSLEETAILNNADPDEDARRGQSLKIVVPGRAR
ncbi:MAG TPA: M48 family metalloprotease [Candidatus Limnocylindria bacterium]|nr:M48 family metalloprotease [Candidatus Limnocylindria bacterium]